MLLLDKFIKIPIGFGKFTIVPLNIVGAKASSEES